MSNCRTLKVYEHIFIYFIHGAMINDLFIPYKYKEGGLHYSGFNAWIHVAIPILLYLAIHIRHGLFLPLKNNTRFIIEMLLIVAAIFIFVYPK